MNVICVNYRGELYQLKTWAIFPGRFKFEVHTIHQHPLCVAKTKCYERQLLGGSRSKPPSTVWGVNKIVGLRPAA